MAKTKRKASKSSKSQNDGCPHCGAPIVKQQGQNTVFKGAAQHEVTGTEYACGYRIKNGNPSQPCSETGNLLLPERMAEIKKRDEQERKSRGRAK